MESGKIEWRGGLEESVVEGVVVWGCAGAHNGPWSICFRAVPWHSAQCGGRREGDSHPKFPKSALPLKETVPSINRRGCPDNVV